MYPPILLAWIWLLLFTTHAFPLTVNRSPDHSSRPTSAQFDGDPGILFKRGPGDDNAGGSTTSKPSSSTVTSTPSSSGPPVTSSPPQLRWAAPYRYDKDMADRLSDTCHRNYLKRKLKAQAAKHSNEATKLVPNNPHPLPTPTPNSQPPQAVPPSIQRWRQSVGFNG